MKRIAVLIASLAAATLVFVTTPAAQADEWGPWNISDPQDICVRTDFTITGSRWQIHKSVANWNSVQSSVHFRVGYDESCSDVLVHRYFAQDGLCGRTDFIRLWDMARVENGVVIFAGADVYLNDNCSAARATRKWVIAHELGHAIGLIHGTGDDSVMSPTYLTRTYKGVPGATDVATLAALYAPRQ